MIQDMDINTCIEELKTTTFELLAQSTLEERANLVSAYRIFCQCECITHVNELVYYEAKAQLCWMLRYKERQSQIDTFEVPDQGMLFPSRQSTDPQLSRHAEEVLEGSKTLLLIIGISKSENEWTEVGPRRPTKSKYYDIAAFIEDIPEPDAIYPESDEERNAENGFFIDRNNMYIF